MPVRQSYSDRVFTTSVVSYPELVHIGDDKDFSPVIKKHSNAADMTRIRK